MRLKTNLNLLYIIANITDTLPGNISIVIGDAHIYESHIEQVKLQLSRTLYELPTLTIKQKINDIDSCTVDNFIIKNYKCHPGIKADMVA